MDPSQLSIGVAFLAGLVSFLSPCVLPLVPIYLIQLVGQSVHQTYQGQQITTIGTQQMAGIQQGYVRLITFLHAATFVVGFTLGFVALGATASTLGSFLNTNLIIVRQVGGIVLIFIGLHLAGVLKLPFLYWQKRFEFRPNRPSYPASLLTGIVFAIGWTPCVGVILAPILALAAQSTTLRQGVLLLLAYSLGLGIPFLLLGLGLNQASHILSWLKPHLGKIEVATGIAMIAVGLLVFFNLLPLLNQFFNVNVGMH